MMRQRILGGVAAIAALGLLSAGQALAQPQGVQGEVLGTVRIPAAVLANGKPLPAGSYQVRVTSDEATPVAAGASGSLERWVEFVQRGEVKGREVASIIPDAEMTGLQGETPRRPKPGTTSVQKLKSGDYWRVWINKGGNNYLIHLPPA
jgi:hypothetical protein